MSLPFLLMVWCQNDVVVVVDDASMEKMSGGDVDVESYLNSRNTIGHGTTTQILKRKHDKIVGVGSGNRWWCYAEVVVVCGSDGEIWTKNGAVDGSDAARGRMAGLDGPDVRVGQMSVGETDPRTPMGPADRAPFGSAAGGDRTKSRSRRSTRAVYPASELSREIILLLLLV